MTIPVILLKTASSGHTDPYTTHLTSNPLSLDVTYHPIYVPVLEHSFFTEPIFTAFEAFRKETGINGATSKFPYGGLIFTSQRAVEAFAAAITDISFIGESDPLGKESWILQCLEHLAVPLYAVGPATALSLDKIRVKYLPACRVLGGEDAGTGEMLAGLILEDYNASRGQPIIETASEKHSSGHKKPLLFLTGAKHRDIIPVTLRSASMEQRIDVEEAIVYASAESQSFSTDIAATLKANPAASFRWVVIFSPTGGETLLRALGWLDDESAKIHGPDDPCWVGRTTFVASIGPTTRDYVKKKFGLEVDVCAEKPSPEGVRQGVEDFMQKQMEASKQITGYYPFEEDGYHQPESTLPRDNNGI
ncbi:MAG: hypothetical protein LQ345_000273 [Seirophora villosa]|nr:MAG: hypothetical protein LQ345_000273 [Seirophora villosa]